MLPNLSRLHCRSCVSISETFEIYDDALGSAPAWAERRLDPDTVCSICLEPLRDRSDTRITEALQNAGYENDKEVEALFEDRFNTQACGHCFHHTCLASGIIKGLRRCPLCREPFDIEVIRSVLGDDDDDDDDGSDVVALFTSAFNGDLAVMTRLLNDGVDIHSRNDSLEFTQSNPTLLMIASRGAHTDAVRLLLNRGAFPDAVDDFFNTPLIYATASPRPSAAAVVRMLLNAGANVEAAGEHGTRALMNASRTGNVEVLRVLLAAGADVNALDSQSGTALMHVSRIGALEVLGVLIAAGADVNNANNLGETTLMDASALGMTGAVRALLAAGANVNAVDVYAESALDRAMQNAHADVAEVLRAAGAR